MLLTLANMDTIRGVLILDENEERERERETHTQNSFPIQLIKTFVCLLSPAKKEIQWWLPCWVLLIWFEKATNINWCLLSVCSQMGSCDDEEKRGLTSEAQLEVVGRPTQLIYISDIYLLSWLSSRWKKMSYCDDKNKLDIKRLNIQRCRNVVEYKHLGWGAGEGENNCSQVEPNTLFPIIYNL